jgi:hypothetical protein
MSASMFVNAAAHADGWPTVFKVIYLSAALSLCAFTWWSVWKGHKR